MILPLMAPILLAARMIVTIADEIPNLDVAATCRAETAAIQASVQFCIQDERRAHDRLVQEWARFAVADKVDCSRTTESGGSSSYVELLTCLELARDAKKAPGN
jgi:hypothetical protein